MRTISPLASIVKSRASSGHLDIGVAKNRQGDIEKPSAVVRRVFTPAAVAVRLQGLQTQHRHRLGNDAAHADAGLFGVARQLQRRFGERFANQCRRRRRQRRQREQARDDRRIATHLQRTELVLFEIDVPRSRQRNDQAGCRLGQHGRAGARRRSLASQPSPDAPPPAVRAKSHPAAQPTGLCHQLQRLAAVPGRQAEGAQPVSKERSAHSRRRIGRSSSLTKRGGLRERAIDAPQFVGASGSRPL
jgi:hypothetical protein